MKYFGYSVVAIGLTSTVLFTLFVVPVNRFSKDKCAHIAEVARDDKALTYLEGWANDNVIDKGYYLVTGEHGSVSARSSDGSTRSIGAPLEEFSQIEEKNFRFAITKLGGHSVDPITNENVAYIRFGSGRNSILLLKNGYVLDSHRGHDEASGHLLKINESTYAYCADAKF